MAPSYRRGGELEMECGSVPRGLRIQLERAPDPPRGDLLRQRVLAEPVAQAREVHVVEVLVLIEAGEHVRGLARRGIAVRLQALRADLLHHALHRRVDGADAAMTGLEIRRED